MLFRFPHAGRLVTNLAVAWLSTFVLGAFATADDWPAYHKDNSRGGVTAESLAPPLSSSWKYQSPVKPKPAWPGPAKADLYNKVYKMRARMVYDKVFHVVSASGLVFFGSSADDQLHCLDANTGKQRWSFFAEAPIRFAPAIVEGRVYFGADDGCLYCLRAQDGKLVWKQKPPRKDYRLMGNGRVISIWAIRTGVVIRDGIVYYSRGLFSKEGVYLLAAKTSDGKLVWETQIPDLPAQGYLLASETRIYVPTGRDNPLVFERKTGKRLRAVAGAGGTYALLTGDTLIFGPGKTGQLGLVEPEQKDQLVTFAGDSMLVADGMFYLKTPKEIRALDQKRYLTALKFRRVLQKKQGNILGHIKVLAPLGENYVGQLLQLELTVVREQIRGATAEMSASIPWRTLSRHSLAMIMAGKFLYCGADGEVAAFRATDGKQVWAAKVDGAAYGLAVAGGKLFVSTDSGAIHCFTPPVQKNTIRPASVPPKKPAG